MFDPRLPGYHTPAIAAVSVVGGPFAPMRIALFAGWCLLGIVAVRGGLGQSFVCCAEPGLCGCGADYGFVPGRGWPVVVLRLARVHGRSMLVSGYTVRRLLGLKDAAQRRALPWERRGGCERAPGLPPRFPLGRRWWDPRVQACCECYLQASPDVGYVCVLGPGPRCEALQHQGAQLVGERQLAPQCLPVQPTQFQRDRHGRARQRELQAKDLGRDQIFSDLNVFTGMACVRGDEDIDERLGLRRINSRPSSQQGYRIVPGRNGCLLPAGS